MTKKELGLVLLCFLIMMLFIGVCGGGFAKTDFEKELKAAQKKGYARRYYIQVPIFMTKKAA